MTLQNSIRIAAALMSRSDGRVLLVRKKATESFMQPGGKIETGEHPQDALRRELSEELGIDIDPSEMTYVGRYTAPAANEPGRQVDAEVFRIVIAHPVAPGSRDRGDSLARSVHARSCQTRAFDAGQPTSAVFVNPVARIALRSTRATSASLWTSPAERPSPHRPGRQPQRDGRGGRPKRHSR
ncbi:NUDIX hydrolase [Bradyrhizobium sp. CCBAU 45394]|uniref:NUDIX hydrolase n=1 Tax=Bradyrhizobium sp. CCBAU 45394 TaxID=1325087 RepID=UPI002FE0E9A6